MSARPLPSILPQLDDLFARSRRGKFSQYFDAFQWIGCILILAGCLWLLSQSVLERMENVFLDGFFRHRPPLAAHPDIVLIEIDEETLQTVGPWPWPLNYHARMVETLSRWGAKTIVYEIPLKIDEDMQAARELKAYRDKLFLPLLLEGKTPKKIWVHAMTIPLEPETDRKQWQPEPELLTPLAKGIGHINLFPDRDGVLRRVYLEMTNEGVAYPYLAVPAALDFKGQAAPGEFVRKGLDQHGSLLINWAGKWRERFKRYSFAEVIRSQQALESQLKPSIPPETFQGKICVISATAKGVTRNFASPIDASAPSMAVFAHILNGFLTDQFVRTASFPLRALCLILIGMTASLLFVFFRTVPAFIAGLALGILWLLVSFLLFLMQGLWTFVFYPSVLILGLFVFCAIYDQFVSGKEKSHLFDLATRDGLTGLYVIRHFREILNHTVEEVQRKKEPLSLILIDIDNFKVINDTYGHPAGDMVLKKTAQVVYGCFRSKRPIQEADFVARYGGEEFIIMLRKATLAQAAEQVAERIRRSVEQETFLWEGRRIAVTISLGVSTLHPTENIPDFMVRRADEALYDAKRSGKNRTCKEKTSSG